ncbi:hypothetical protein WJX72_007694 [[Myrmecia] bisecta]|uniref:Starch synthase catalytic domain-containing protein n=1 Tax=[Myrmecia] bisecta TaxID=41462 RepID=A0AAW1QRJ4_9CHLO
MSDASSQKLKLVFVSTEVTPWSKVGGLGDVIGALPVAMAARGHSVMTVAPSPLTHRASREAHGSLGSGQWPALGSAEALSSPRSSLQEALAAGGMQDAGGDGAPGSHSQPSGAANSLMSPFVRYFWVRQDGVDRVFVDHPCYADTTDIYGTGNVNTYVESGEFPDLDLRYSILCQAALAAPHLLWPRKQAHAFAAQLSAGLQGSRVAFCIHNLAYQGTYPLEAFKRLCLPQRALPALLWPPVPGVGLEQQEALRGAGGMVYAGEACEVAPHEPPSLNWMHAALSESDAVFTVSPNYAQEIRLDPDMACQMQDLLQRKGVRGIMNGIDTTEWDPATDPHLPEVARYTPATAVLGKAAAKAVLQAKFGLLQALDVPLIGLIGRLTEQKGVDVVLSAVPALLGPARRAALAATYGAGPNPALSTAPEMQMVMLGTGEAWMEAALEGLQASFPGSAVGLTYFDEAAAHLIMAASDFILVPSRFEPCGLVAECAVRYGAVPIVAPVGGLKDLVTPEVGYLTERIGDKRDPNQHRIAVASLYSTVMQAVKEYGTPRFQQLQQNCMALDVSWDKPAAEWEQALLQMMQQQ